MDKDKKPPKVVNLLEERAKRDHEAGQKAFEDGLAFKFEPFEYTETEPLGVGIIEGDHPICVVMKDDLSGIMMTKESAKKFGLALLEAAETDDVYPVDEPPKRGA